VWTGDDSAGTSDYNIHTNSNRIMYVIIVSFTVLANDAFHI